MRSFIFLQSLLPSSSVRLGRLILNTKFPHQDFLDPFDGDDGRPRPAECIRRVQTNFTSTQTLSKSSKLRTYFNDVLSISYETHNSGVASVTAPQVTTHDLTNSGTWFHDACARPETRSWLEEAIDSGSTVYLVVGLRTLQDARLTKDVSSGSVRGVKTQVPTALVAGLSDAAGIATPGVASEKDNDHSENTVFDAPGEQIFAVQYRKVKFQWLASRKIENIVLDNTRWKAYWDIRGGEEDSDDDEDVLEVELTEVNDLEEDYFTEDKIDDL